MDDFANNLTRIREEKGLSRQDLATLAGVSVAAIGYYENGHREPTLSTLKAIATALNVSIDVLLDFHVNEFEYYKNLIESLNTSNVSVAYSKIRNFKVLEQNDSIIIRPQYFDTGKNPEITFHDLNFKNKMVFCSMIKKLISSRKTEIENVQKDLLTTDLYMYVLMSDRLHFNFNFDDDNTAPDK